MTDLKRVDQGWATFLHEGPHWILDLEEWVGQVVQEPNPFSEDRRLAKNPA